MNITCSICGELFTENSDISAPKCGHTFHHHCIIQWVENSATCPACRRKTSFNNISRIYLNTINGEDIKEDPVVLSNRLEQLQLALTEKNKLIRESDMKMRKLSAEMKTIEDEYELMKIQYDTYKNGNASLREQIKMYQEQIKIIDAIQKENKMLREKLRDLNIEHTVLHGSYAETKKTIDHSDVKTLSMISISLKKELISMEQKRNSVLKKLQQTENELSMMKADCEQFKKEIDDLEYELREHKQCEAEMANLRIEICKLMASKEEPINPSLIRVVTESPAPKLTKPKGNNDVSFETVNSPSVSKRVEDIKESESPYLTVKSNCLSMFLKDDVSMKFKNTASSSIFKKSTSSSSTAPPKPKAVPEASYNGFGGHSKEDKYPTPKLAGLKRCKSQILASKRLKKSDKPNMKLEDFFTLSQLDD